MVSYSHASSDGDPSKVEIRDAATIMVVRGSPVEVLMVQRASKAVFGPSAWVFPGGRVEGHDGDRASDLPWRHAAIRETLEESGLLLCSPSWQSDRKGAADKLAELRRAILAGEVDLVPALYELGVEPDVSQMHEVGRFTTPVGPPRRFDTWFYLTAEPTGQLATPDGAEVTNAAWISPAEAIERWLVDDFPMMTVTKRMLSCLARYSSVDEALEVAKAQHPERRVRVNDPDGAYEVLLPEDPGYEHAHVEVEHGWVRL